MLKKSALFLLILVFIFVLCSCQKYNDAQYAIGNYVTFGSYPQSESGDDSTPIKWLVLDRDGSKALLISKHALDCQPYNTEDTDVTWETCSLRAWLNDTFLNNAFSTKEQTGIIMTTVTNSKEQGYNEWAANGGSDTQDKVFLFSLAEVNKYLINDSERKCAPTDDPFDMEAAYMCAPTDFAIAKGCFTTSSFVHTVNGRATSWWWLRSPGSSSSFAANVDYRGMLGNFNVNRLDGVVRPAIWVDLASGVF